MNRCGAASALLFAASAAITNAWSTSMSAMGGMPMPGGWTMSMTWMRMPGQTWPGIAASFLGMWVVMMVAMMLPSLATTITNADRGARPSCSLWLTLIAGLGYFFVWTVFGMIVLPVGIALATVEMQQPAVARVVPIAAGAIVLIAGALQFTSWKAHHLACYREACAPMGRFPGDTGTAWRFGVRLGLHCGRCCANLMVILLVVGVMDVRAMALVAAAITAERLASDGVRAARTVGALVIVAGVIAIARAVALA